LLQQHLESGLWEFRHGEPQRWHAEGGKLTPAEPERLLSIAPDALENQRREDELVRCEMETLDRTLGAQERDLIATLAGPLVAPEATVAPSADIGPGTQVQGASIVEDGARLYRTLVRDATVHRDARLLRCSVVGSTVGKGVSAVSSVMHRATVADGSSLSAARIEDSSLDGVARVSPYASIRSTTLARPCIVGSNIVRSEIRTTFMSFHMPGQVSDLVAEPSRLRVDGTVVEVHAIPMLGGGLRVLGQAGKEVKMECSFIGSNAILEAGAFVGFGCFVLGRLRDDEGLLPFTVSTAPGPERDQIGMVVHSFANMVITHYVSWAFQALGPEQAEHVARLVPAMLEEGRDAVEWGMRARASGEWDDGSPHARYKSLKLYSDSQLRSGLKAYQVALADQRWTMRYEGGELRFVGPGVWKVADGVARWQQGT
jgi:hypothetical protein